MSKIYKALVNKSFEFEFDSDKSNELDAIKLNDSKFHILRNNRSYIAEITDSQFQHKKYSVKINNNTYVVDIQNELDELIKVMGFEVGATKKVNDLKAPMPGLILDVIATIGMEVKENDTLLILEAMKMENVLTSPRDGIIKSISVKKGDAVEKNQLLIEFE